MKTLKCIVIGDGLVGKTCMLMTYTTNSFPHDIEYIPTVFESFTSRLICGGEAVQLEIWDTAGQEEYDNLRPLSYPHVDVFVVCFSLICRTSYDNVRLRWYPEAHHHVPDAPIVLVGTKKDLRDGEKAEGGPVTQNGEANKVNTGGREEGTEKLSVSCEEGLQLMQEINAIKYVECSAVTKVGLREIFEEAARIVLFPPLNEKKRERRKGSIGSMHYCQSPCKFL